MIIFAHEGFFRLERGRIFKDQVDCLILESASLDSPGIIAWPIYSPNPVRRHFWAARVFLGDIWYRMKQFEWRSSGPATFLYSYYVVLGKTVKTQPNRLKFKQKSQECFDNTLSKFQEILLNLKVKFFKFFSVFKNHIFCKLKQSKQSIVLLSNIYSIVNRLETWALASCGLAGQRQPSLMYT